jgi:hypothetical protein
MRRTLLAGIACVLCSASHAWESQELGVTSGCGDEKSGTVTVCHPSKRPITKYSTIVVSRNCTGDIRSESIVNGCVVYQLYARGCGEDVVNLKFTKIRNCKGRGWISVKVNVPD